MGAMNHALPVVGAALATHQLPACLPWLLDASRDLEITDPLTNIFFEGPWEQTGWEAAKLLDGHQGRRGLHAPFSSIPIDAHDRRVAAIMRDRLYQSLEFAALTGGTHLVLHSPFLYFGTAQSVARGAALDDTIARTSENLAPVVERAASQSCLLVIENIHDLRPGPLDRLVRSFDSPWVRRSLDTGHANLMRARGAPPADVWVDEAGELLAHLHLADNDGEFDRHWACGEGTIAWTALFLAVARLPQPPRLILEMSPARQEAALRWLTASRLAI